MLGILSAKREDLFPAHVWNRSFQIGSQGGLGEPGERARGSESSVQLELRRLVSSGRPLDLDCLTSWPPCQDEGDPTSLDAELDSSYSLGLGATGVRLALSVPRGLRVAVGCECSDDAAGAIIALESLQMAEGWLRVSPLNITVPDVAKGLWAAHNISSPAAGQSLCIHAPQSDGGLLSFILAGVPVVVSLAPSAPSGAGEGAGAARRVLPQAGDAAWGTVGSARADVAVHSRAESIDLAVAVRYPSIGVANVSMKPVALSVGPFQLSEEPDPMEHHGRNALLECYRGGRSCEVMKMLTPEVLATASSSRVAHGQESSFGLSVVAPDGGDLIAHLFRDWSREKQQAYRLQGAIAGEGLVDVSFLWPRFLLPSALLGVRPSRRLVGEDTAGLELAFNLTDPWDGSEVLHGTTTTGGVLRNVYFTGVSAFVDPTGERPSQVAADVYTGWAVDMGGVDVQFTIPTIRFDFSSSYGNKTSPQLGHMLLREFELNSSNHELTVSHVIAVEDFGSVVDFSSGVRSGAPAELNVRCGQPGNGSSLLDALLGKLELAVSMQMLMSAADDEWATGTQRRLSSPDDAPSLRLQVQSSSEELRVLGDMQVPASLHAFGFRVGFGEVRLNLSAPGGGAIGSLFVPETDLRPGLGGNIQMDMRMSPSDVQVLRSQALDLLLSGELHGTLRAEGSVSPLGRWGARWAGRAGLEVPLRLAAAGLAAAARPGAGGEHAVLSLAELLRGAAAAGPAPSPAPAGAEPEQGGCSLSFGAPSLRGLEVVGGEELGRPVRLPCLQACPDGAAPEGQFGVRLAVGLAARLPCLLQVPYVLENCRPSAPRSLAAQSRVRCLWRR
ncbi:unnamed protein product [Prorocentrum cordatum]|uniref:Uncharacterized protein n=1 Tax=Prorocentrum cordatum TaxID=2364126 RepID=A0ABN9XM80_9DINO|nr:unnamed protein product [Polarella glacialis]